MSWVVVIWLRKQAELEKETVGADECHVDCSEEKSEVGRTGWPAGLEALGMALGPTRGRGAKPHVQINATRDPAEGSPSAFCKT